MGMEDAYEKLIRRLYPPRVVADNDSCEDATVIRVDSVNKHGTLLQVVQVLADMNLTIKKSYISSDCGWFIYVFYVTDYHGSKIKDREVINYIKEEFYIRHTDGRCINSEAERERIVQCLEAAIERRANEGIELELCTDDRFGLLAEITRIFRENGLSIRRAEISTKGGKANDTFYVTDVAGNLVDPRIMEFIQQEIGQTILLVKQNSYHLQNPPQQNTMSFLFGNFFKCRS